jgi:pimeloyl-ACP methyl ester carboxylesterase
VVDHLGARPRVDQEDVSDVDSGQVASADGTAIGYLSVGVGPPLLVLHGAMQSALSQRDLALALADRFTVVLADRRGRGSSGPFGDWSLAREVDDVAALRAATAASRALGVSSGALILLNAALAQPFEALALFEPPLLPAGEAPAGLVERLEAELGRGDVRAALVTGMRGARMGPGLVRALPRPLLERMTATMMDRGGDVPSFRELAPTLPYDSRIVAECAVTADRYRAVTAPTLLLGGARSGGWLKRALSTLESTLPDVRRVEIPGIDHGGTENADRRGKPALVASALDSFR